MRIVIVGATGNVGTSVLEALGRDGAVDSLLASRAGAQPPRTRRPSSPLPTSLATTSCRTSAAPTASSTWRARLQPTSPDWLDLALSMPLLDCTRACEELGWTPARDGVETIRELLQGMADRAGGPTPPLRSGDRAAEIRAGVGGKSV